MDGRVVSMFNAKSSVPFYKLINNRIYTGPEEDEAAAKKAADEKAAADKAAADKLAAPQFTQAQVDEMINKRFRKEKEAQEKILVDYKKLQETQGITTKQAEEYAQRIAELETATLSKEELAKRETERLQKTAKAEQEKLAGERDLFKGLYASMQIENAITKAATDPEIKALRPEQMTMLLKSQTRLVPKEGQGGKTVFEVAVDWNEGEQVLQIPVKEALKRMKEQPAVYGNLFESDAKGGLGGETVTPGSGALNPNSYSDFETYKKNRPSIIQKSTQQK